MYGKIFDRVFTGSMYGSGPTVFAVWAYVIANAEPPGVVELNPRLLAACIGTDTASIRAALDYLCQPDADSQNPDEDGRRLLPIGGLMYQVVSFDKYRDMRDAEERREYMRRYMANKRAANKLTKVNSKQPLAKLAKAEAEAEVEAEAEEENTYVETAPAVSDSRPVSSEKSKEKPPPCPHDALVDAFHEACPSLPRVVVWDGSRKQHLQARWRQVWEGERFDQKTGVDLFRGFFRRVNQSQFLTGRAKVNGDRKPFRADLAWLVKPENFAKVIEGRYDQ